MQRTRAQFSLIYHIVWCPKYRRPVLEGQVAVRLEEVIRDVCDELLDPNARGARIWVYGRIDKEKAWTAHPCY